MARAALAIWIVLLASARVRVADADPRTGLLAPRSLIAARTHAPIHVDGKLDEAAWATAPIGGHFIQQRPKPGAEARLHTEVRVLFDDDALYIGVRLDDPAATEIIAPFGRRDDWNTADWCFVEIDSRRDRRTAFTFGVNPAGSQVDGVIVDDTNYDTSWDAVWEVATSIDDHGWTAEYRIPFSVLPFRAPSPGMPMTWGFNVYRSNPHTGEQSNWSPRTPQLAGVVSLFNALEIAAAPLTRRFDLTPYVLLSPEQGVRGGLDLDLGLGANVSLIATVLPDFGQVEADPAQLNLTSFELFLPERRPFFTEGLDAFRFDTSLPLVSRGDSFVEEAPFYSRRIGREPEGTVAAGVTVPSATTILGAAKLFGQTADGWRLGVLASSTLGAHASDGTIVEVPEQALVARAVKDSPDGDSAFGLFASALYRGTGMALAREDGVAGVDGRIRWDDQTWEARAWALTSGQLGSAAAITALADQPWHYLDRVDAPRLHVSPTATSLSGAAGEARISKVGGDLIGSIAVRGISPQFDDDSLGFQRNSDWLVIAATWSRRWFPAGKVIRNWRIGTDNAGLGWSWAGERRAAVVDTYAAVGFANYWFTRLTAQHEASVLSTEWLRGGPAFALPPRETLQWYLGTDGRNPTRGSVYASYADEPGSGSHDALVNPALSWRLSRHLAGSLIGSYDDQVIGHQYVANSADSTQFLVARVHQRTTSLALQVDAAITSRLIVQIYAQPFISIGAYNHYGLVTDARSLDAQVMPTAVALADTTATVVDGQPWEFSRIDGAERSLIGSIVARWEIRPGSFLTAVWNHHGDETVFDQQFSHSLDHLVRAPSTDVVLVKLAWRFAL